MPATKGHVHPRWQDRVVRLSSLIAHNRGDEAVASSRHSFDEARRLRSVPQSFPQLLNRIVQAVVKTYEGIAGPDAFLKLFPSHYFPGTLRKELEDLKRLLLQPDS